MSRASSSFSTPFDRITRTLGQRSSRRRAIAQLGGAGVAAAVVTLPAIDKSALAAMQSGCQFSLRATFATGPFTGASFDADVNLFVSEDEIDEGYITVTGSSSTPLPSLSVGTTYSLVGSIHGRAIHLRVAVEDGQFLSLEGTAQFPFNSCNADAAGTFGGPTAGTVGTWTTIVANDEPTSPIPTTPTEPSDDPAPPPPTPEPTMTTCEPMDCGVTMVWNPDTCDCACPDNGLACGDVCCPSRSICMDAASGTCSCPPGTVLCGNTCVECADPAGMDYNTCVCYQN